MDNLNLARKLLKKELTITEYKKIIQQKPSNILSVVVNDICNLQCKQCYIEYYKGPAHHINIEKFKNKINSLPNLQAVTLSAKEPLLHPQIKEILMFLKEKRDKNKNFKFGFISNGVLLKNFIETIKETTPDYVDISLEGPEKVNDQLRGEGTYNKVIDSLEVFFKNELNKTTHITTSTTLTKINYKYIKEHILDSYKIGIRNFGFAVLLSNDVNEKRIKDILLTPDIIDEIIEIIHSIELEDISIILDFTDSNDFEMFLNSKYNNPDLLKEDENGTLYIKMPNKKTKAYIRFEALTINGSFRMTLNAELTTDCLAIY